MSPVRSRLAAAALASRNGNVRRVELAWGAAISAKWAYFVALGVFAYDAGGASAVGLAGLIRLLPAAIVAPGAASLGDRIPRERLLLGAALLGSVSLAGSAVAAFAGSETGVYGCAALVGISSTLIRPTLQALLPSLTRTPEELIASNAATSTVESVGTLVGPLVAGVLVEQATVGVTFAVAAGALAVGVGLILRVHAEGPVAGRAASPSRPAFAWRTVAQHPGAPVVVTLMVARRGLRHRRRDPLPPRTRLASATNSCARAARESRAASWEHRPSDGAPQLSKLVRPEWRALNALALAHGDSGQDRRCEPGSPLGAPQFVVARLF